MENKKQKNLLPVVVILIIIVIGLGGFIVYDKMMNNNEKCVNQDEIINNEENSYKTESYIKEKMLKTKTRLYSEMTIKNYFEYYMRYIPWNDDSNLQYISINDITSDQISYVVWRYVFENASDIYDRKMTISEVNNFLYEYFNLSNYDVKELVKEDTPTEGKPWNIFGLIKEDGYYKATVVAIDFYIPEYKVNYVTYTDETIFVSFNVGNTNEGGDFQLYGGGTLTLRNNNGNFNFEKIEFNSL